MAKDPSRTVVASNRKARHDYAIESTIEAGLVLTGTEVKALRAGRASLTDGFVTIHAGEAYLENVHIPEYSQGTWNNHAPRRRRKLLMHRHEIDKLASTLAEKGQALIPLQLYFSDGRAKVELGVGKGKREDDKRHSLKERQDRRETDRAVQAHKHR